MKSKELHHLVKRQEAEVMSYLKYKSNLHFAIALFIGLPIMILSIINNNISMSIVGCTVFMVYILSSSNLDKLCESIKEE